MSVWSVNHSDSKEYYIVDGLFPFLTLCDNEDVSEKLKFREFNKICCKT
jgi:hypothetical protein